MKYLKLLVAATILAVSSTAMAGFEGQTASDFVYNQLPSGYTTTGPAWSDSDFYSITVTKGNVLESFTVGVNVIDGNASFAGGVGAGTSVDNSRFVYAQAAFGTSLTCSLTGGTDAICNPAPAVEDEAEEETSEEEVAQAQPIDTAYMLMTGTINGVKEMMIMYIDMRDGQILGKPMVLQFFGTDHNWNDTYETIYMDMDNMPEDTKMLMTSLPQ